ncbi:enoyl-CoA hydratase/isomerase family protein [Rhodococcus koreensis]|uniref:Enoyl-CoA hydratase/carnithine racemase n=1 Tax=Rhodococcus koreensis TaxID=99653 RepID=A0A1H4II12_9NOCA|nr:Enoyl-CoA hydratase/carnithine racemase [Rhodococcus koreensis]
MALDISTAAVTYEVRNSIAWLTINRPDARNSLNRAVREGLFAGVRRFNDDESAKVLVLTGSGEKAFCAGGDLKEMSQEQLTVPPVDFVPQFGRNIEVDKPTIAAVNGAAFAGGFLLAQTCDLCIASSTATFAISEVKIGRGSPWAAPLPLMIPPRIAMEIVLTGAPLTAQRAYEIGFVNRVVEPDELVDTTQRFAELIAANAPLSVSAGKKTAKLTAEHPLSGAFEMAEKIWEPVYLSDDAQEGMLAFSEKRRPHWKGH